MACYFLLLYCLIFFITGVHEGTLTLGSKYSLQDQCMSLPSRSCMVYTGWFREFTPLFHAFKLLTHTYLFIFLYSSLKTMNWPLLNNSMVFHSLIRNCTFLFTTHTSYTSLHISFPSKPSHDSFFLLPYSMWFQRYSLSLSEYSFEIYFLVVIFCQFLNQFYGIISFF